ncbi:biotin/lipoyl-containing protein [Metabacillus sp. YM-086]|uniref:biotin/lipoyl-containing protein n=1 Tax=Metabacillus sp. YM-086 TaxID=3341729 RepID=UPI003A8B61C4
MNPIYSIESLDDGVVNQVCIHENEYVYEWEPLFQIKTDKGNVIDITIGASGLVKDISVKVGDPVYRCSLLAKLHDDNKITGSD